MANPYDTNLAAEFHVMSVLHRLGADVALSLGNKKAVDITVGRAKSEAITIDVKGVAGKYDWPVDNVKIPDHSRYFVVLVSFDGKIATPMQALSVWVIPAHELPPVTVSYKTRKVISRSRVSAQAQAFRDAWHLIV